MNLYRPRIRMELDKIIMIPLLIIVLLRNPLYLIFKSEGTNYALLNRIVPYVPYILGALLIYRILYVLRLSYVLDDHGNVVKVKGVIGRFRQDIPYKRITNIHKNRKWWYRLVGLTQIQIQTAGSDEIEMSLDGLLYDEGEEIYETLKKFKGIKGDGT